MNYDRGLLQKLADYDALLFTPVLEDTPRMIFDGYAAGLPLVATDIEYVKERHHAEGATLLLDRTDEARSAALLSGLSRNPAPLAALARAARASAEHHAAENWYRRRAEWTFEAVERHRCGVRMHA
jgi:glycosyltransferase involved in cell wall biosynthesis